MQENVRMEEQEASQALGENASSGGCPGMLHRIERGDTLYLLGKKYQVSVAAIMFANPYTDIYNLQVGDELCIPRIRRANRQDGLEIRMRSQGTGPSA